MMGRLAEIANEPCPPAERCDAKHLGQCLRMMLAVLPRRNADDLSGELFVAAYQRMLGDMARDRVTFMADQAMRRCKWFPTIAECIEIADDWRRSDAALTDWLDRTSIARRLMQGERLARQADNRIPPPPVEQITQEQVDAMSETMINLGLGSGALWRDEDGRVRPVIF